MLKITTTFNDLRILGLSPEIVPAVCACLYMYLGMVLEFKLNS